MTPLFYCRVLMLLVVVFSAAASNDVTAADKPAVNAPAGSQNSAPVDELTDEAQQAANDLKARLPEDSEARAMLDQILAGSQLGPGEGWFKTAISNSRFDWKHICKAYDADGDEQIARREFAGSDDDFARLDRDADHALTAQDFDWSRHSLERTPGVMLFFQADRDANGQVTPDELLACFNSLDTDSHGFLALDDLRDQFQPPSNNDRQRRPDAPNRSTLVLGLQRQEIGSLQPGPNVDEPAPDFTLKSLSGEEVTLSEEVGEQPIVLIFGNFTCGPFRSQAGNLAKLHERYKDRAKFFLVYVREAHPSDGWSMASNQRVGIDVAQPHKDGDRVEVASTCRQHLDLDIPFLVDSVDDRVGATYSGMPNRLYLIDSTGTIAFKNGRGPFGFHPRELEQALVLSLNERGKSASTE